MMTNAYTTTLSTGQELVIQPTADFGEVITAGLLLGLLAVLIFEFVIQRIYGRNR